METIYRWFLAEPQRLIDGGWGLFLAGFTLLFAGLWGIVVTTSIGSVIHLMPSSSPDQPTKMLADIYPTLPTWWIPESFFGFALAFLLIGLGIIAALFGKKLKTLL